jgi:ring-1,2-phenylacetyl-CoA epoxidase subunit PaaD
MGQIEDDVRAKLAELGVAARVTTRLSPPWTTDWMSDEAKAKLHAYGIAPPHTRPAPDVSVMRFIKRPVADVVSCPHCGSSHTVVTSQFGSTACKALYKCLDCQEPFDYFKPY